MEPTEESNAEKKKRPNHMLRAYDAVFGADRAQLSSTERIVLLAYARHLSWQDWTAWPGLAKLTAMTGLSRNAVQYVRRGLIERKLLTPVKDLDRPWRGMRSGLLRAYRGQPTIAVQFEVEAVESLVKDSAGNRNVLTPRGGTAYPTSLGTPSNVVGHPIQRGGTGVSNVVGANVSLNAPANATRERATTGASPRAVKPRSGIRSRIGSG